MCKIPYFAPPGGTVEKIMPTADHIRLFNYNNYFRAKLFIIFQNLMDQGSLLPSRMLVTYSDLFFSGHIAFRTVIINVCPK